MPKSKKFVVDDSSEDSESDYEPKKKSKKKEEKKKAAAKDSDDSDSPFKNGEVHFQLGRMRYVSVSEFKGRPLVNIREYYEADGELKPGRKGISLSPDQWKALSSHAEEIDEALKDYS